MTKYDTIEDLRKDVNKVMEFIEFETGFDKEQIEIDFQYYADYIFHYSTDLFFETIKQECLICKKKFEGTVKIDICPTCYV